MAEFNYPSIQGPAFSLLDQQCIAFEKHDGSNLRFFWNRQRGWHSTGTRYKWFKEATPVFGPAASIFRNEFAAKLVESLRRFKEYRGVVELIAFCEYFGPNTFSGLHDPDEPKQLLCFDIYLPGRGFVPPADFVTHFGTLSIPKVVYQGAFSRAFIADVRAGKYPVLEGVAAKGVVERRQRKGSVERDVWMAKVKTQTWLDELSRRAAGNPDLQPELEQNLNEQQSAQANREG